MRRAWLVGLNPEIDVDVAEVCRAAEFSEIPESDDEQSHLLSLLSREELLPGWYDDWVLAERESLEQMRLRALDRVSRRALDRGDLALAIEAARSAMDIEPHSEPACEVALRAHLARGDLAASWSEFRRYREATWDNVGVAPSDRILALVESAVGTSVIDGRNPRVGRTSTAVAPASSVAPTVAPAAPPSPPRKSPLATSAATAELPPPAGSPTALPAIAATRSRGPWETSGRNARVLAWLAAAAVLLLAVSLLVAVGGRAGRRRRHRRARPADAVVHPDGPQVLDRVAPGAPASGRPASGARRGQVRLQCGVRAGAGEAHHQERHG